eukprot:959482-Rhodomonas_salina.1
MTRAMCTFETRGVAFDNARASTWLSSIVCSACRAASISTIAFDVSVSARAAPERSADTDASWEARDHGRDGGREGGRGTCSNIEMADEGEWERGGGGGRQGESKRGSKGGKRE